MHQLIYFEELEEDLRIMETVARIADPAKDVFDQIAKRIILKRNVNRKKETGLFGIIKIFLQKIFHKDRN